MDIITEVGRMFYDYGFTEEQISEALHIPIGKSLGIGKYEKNTVKSYKKSYISRINMRKTNKIVTARRKIDIEFDKKFRERIGRIGKVSIYKTRKTVKEKRKDPEYDKNYRKQRSDNITNTHKNWKENKKEEYFEWLSNAGKEGGKTTKRLHPNHFSEIGIIGGNSKYKQYPEDYIMMGKEGGPKGVESLRHQKGKLYLGVKFTTWKTENSELNCARMLHKLIKLPIIDSVKCKRKYRKIIISKITCSFKVDSYHIDFRIPKELINTKHDVFLEFHPCDWYLNPEPLEEYYAQRRKLLDDNGYKNNKLIVIQKVDELKNLFNTLKPNNIHGKNELS